MIRRARREDARAFVELVVELARFEKLAPPSPAARKRLRRGAFKRRPDFELFVAESGGCVVAYAIVLWTYSSFLAKPTLYLEDLYITPGHRGTGLAESILRFLARYAVRRGCGRLEGLVLNWNRRARRFYKKTGAEELPGWVLFRYREPALRRLAAQNRR